MKWLTYWQIACIIYDTSTLICTHPITGLCLGRNSYPFTYSVNTRDYPVWGWKKASGPASDVWEGGVCPVLLWMDRRTRIWVCYSYYSAFSACSVLASFSWFQRCKNRDFNLGRIDSCMVGFKGKRGGFLYLVSLRNVLLIWLPNI